ncbi:UNVERIFIED_CONTAM: UvrB/UvrC motif-containing protein [Campylobacter lari]
MDDKKYPYIKIQLLNKGLNISLSRNIKDKKINTYYYGPFPAGYGAGIILKLLQREAFFENGLIVKNDDPSFWKAKFEKIKDILSFKNSSYLSELKKKMFEAAENMQFEIALDIKNSLNYLLKLKEDQIIELSTKNNIDVIVYEVIDENVYLTVLYYRFGILINKENLTLSLKISLEETLRYFFENFYLNKIKPDIIYANEKLEKINLNLDESFNIIYPKIGANKKVLDLAEVNLENYIKNEVINKQNDQLFIKNNLEKLSKLTTNKTLNNIVIFDNSNLNNSNPVGVAVVYTNGIKNKSLYRKFNLDINTTRHADVEYMKQNVTRFFTSDNNSKDFDLIIVDGGLAQINEAESAINELGLNIPVIGLSKNDFHKTDALITLQKEIIKLKRDAFYNFLAEMQMEVDRFAKQHLRKRHKITSLEGSLTKIKGLGQVYEAKLLNHFKNYSNIYNASIEELSKIVPSNIAKKIKENNQ